VVLNRVVLELADTESRSITLGMRWKRAKKAVRSMFCLSRKRDVRVELCSIMNGGCEVPKVHCGG